MSIADKQGKEQEAELILERLDRRQRAITAQPEWCLKDMDAAIAQAIKELKMTGVENDQLQLIVNGRYKEKKFHNERDRSKAAIAKRLLDEFGNEAPSAEVLEDYLKLFKKFTE